MNLVCKIKCCDGIVLLPLSIGLLFSLHQGSIIALFFTLAVPLYAGHKNYSDCILFVSEIFQRTVIQFYVYPNMILDPYSFFFYVSFTMHHGVQHTESR